MMERLRAEAAERRLEEQRSREVKRSDREFYDEVTRPAMLHTYRFLDELLQHLEYLEEQVQAHYDVPGIGRLDPVMQSHYQLRADTLGEIRSIKLKFLCEAPSDLVCEVRGAEDVRTALTSLERLGMVFSRSREKRNAGVVEEVRLEVRQRFTAILYVTADIEKREMFFRFKNFEGYGDRYRHVNPMDINDQSLDELARYILREPSSWAVAKVDEEARRRLQRNLERDRKRRERGQRRGLFR